MIADWRSISISSSPRWQIDPDALSVFVRGDHVQVFTFAWPGDAFSVFDEKQRAMGCALDQAGTVIKELVRLPFQGNAAMRALVFVHVNLPATAYCKQPYTVDIETPAFALSQINAVTHVLQLKLLRA